MRRKPWGIIYGVAFLIFLAGFFLRVERSAYFPLFVAFCMAYGALTTALMMWPDRKSKGG